MTKFSFLPFLVACSLFVHGTMGDMICETLPQTLCSFAVSSSGKRCKLEDQCKTSQVQSHRLSGHIETDQCMTACGIDRDQAAGVSSDELVSQGFLGSLCSSVCYDNCPNIVDLYSNLAAGEGKSLAAMCVGVAQQPPPARRAALDVLDVSTPASTPTFL